MQAIGICKYLRCCLVTNVGSKQAQSFFLLWCWLGTPRLKTNNQLCTLIETFDEEMNIEQLTEQMISKMQFIYELHKFILNNNA
jgi:hypothetical protein